MEGEKRRIETKRREKKMTKKSERSCQLPANEDGELIQRGEAAQREREGRKDRDKRRAGIKKNKGRKR